MKNSIGTIKNKKIKIIQLHTHQTKNVLKPKTNVRSNNVAIKKTNQYKNKKLRN